MAKQTYDNYEEVAAFLLNQFRKDFGLERVEGKQTLEGESTTWTIDAKGVREGDEGIVVIECRRYTTSKLKQEDLAAIAYRIQDLRGVGGITVSPLELQEGAKRVAAHNNIVHVTLSSESTTSNYIFRFLERLFIGVSDSAVMKESLYIKVIRRGKVVLEMENDEVIYEDSEESVLLDDLDGVDEA